MGLDDDVADWATMKKKWRSLFSLLFSFFFGNGVSL